MTDEFPNATRLCAQCEANARWNEAGGYHELAEQCREYCRHGHRETAALNLSQERGKD